MRPALLRRLVTVLSAPGSTMVTRTGPDGPRPRPGAALALLSRAWRRWQEDTDNALRHDPAARNRAEVTVAYSTMHAIWAHRLSALLWRRGHRLAARLVSQLARAATGVEIHPGATIGRRFFIDHGTGVVIGETAVIGDDVMFYHGVTLGGRSPMARGKRHPTLEDGVMVGAGASILGPVVVGRDAKVGSNAVVTRNVRAGATVVGVPARERTPAEAAQEPEWHI